MRGINKVTLIALLALAACGGEQKNEQKEVKQKQIVRRPPRQEVKDAHGCITSAGYVWSVARNECIRLWEAGSELVPTDRSELVVYAVITDDKAKAEIFIPGDSSFVLAGKGNDTYANDSLTLTVNGNNKVLRKSGRAIYQAESMPVEEEKKPVRKKRRR